MLKQINTSSLQLTWSEAPWDRVVCGFPVLQITAIKIHCANASNDMRMFEKERDYTGAGMVSCRLSHENLLESMLLEEHGFRFIEMLYQPEFNLSGFNIDENLTRLTVTRASVDDLPILLDIAKSVFKNERFKMDPRLDHRINDLRYQNWVNSSFSHSLQELFVVKDGEKIIAFFILELMDDGTCYWHLNAVAPEVQGQGYGRRVWLSMLNRASKDGAQRVRTCIAARNYKVLNLYARLGFFFPPPLMTFHWVRSITE